MSDLERYRTDHLILLVGGNPLPNYVAARVLGRSEGELYLVHTQKSYKIAQRLAECLAEPAEDAQLAGNFKTPPEFVQVSEEDPNDIYNKVRDCVNKAHEGNEISSLSVGLNHTGGTKAMSVHAYEAVKDSCRNAQFSYLNAGRLEMLVYDANRTPRRFRADRFNLPLERLLRLQGLKAIPSQQPRRDPVQPKLAAELARLHTTNEGARAWADWRRNRSNGWSKLPKGQPLLHGVEAVLKELCGDDPQPECVARALGYDRLPSTANWWKGGWLEHYVFAELQKAIAGREDTCDAWMGVKRWREDEYYGDLGFDLDVVVMRRYQLFVFSCIVSDDRQHCKDHLMEAYVRARQAGGDEARVGLVCIYPNPMALQQEIAGDLDASGRIRVFGRDDLMVLADRIREWLDQQP